MMIQVSIGSVVTITMDDEITDERPTPEVMDDYTTRIRNQAIAAYLAVPDAAVEASADTED